MTPKQREEYPAIAQALDYCGVEIQAKNFLSVILDEQEKGFPTDLYKLDIALSHLFQTRDARQLDEQLRALFKNESYWDKAESEILALTHFSDLGRLMSVGWPNGYGKTPPFDGVALMDNVELPFDIKSAKGSASKWLRNVLMPIAEEWAAERWKINIEVRVSGVMTREMIASHKKTLVAEFRRLLYAHQIIPAENIVIIAGDTKIHINVVRSGITFSSRISSPSEHAASVEKTMRTHVKEKARMAFINNAVGFFLVYVRPPSSGTADLRPLSFIEAANHLAESCDSISHYQMWMASVMLDWTPFKQIDIHVVYNTKAAWPLNLNEESFRVSLSSICL